PAPRSHSKPRPSFSCAAAHARCRMGNSRKSQRNWPRVGSAASGATMAITSDRALYEKSARLSRQEERHGLLADTATIGTRAGWEARLAQTGFQLRGHRLVKRSNGR